MLEYALFGYGFSYEVTLSHKQAHVVKRQTQKVRGTSNSIQYNYNELTSYPLLIKGVNLTQRFYLNSIKSL